VPQVRHPDSRGGSAIATRGQGAQRAEVGCHGGFNLSMVAMSSIQIEGVKSMSLSLVHCITVIGTGEVGCISSARATRRGVLAGSLKLFLDDLAPGSNNNIII
jgi:hypothetical protein